MSAVGVVVILALGTTALVLLRPGYEAATGQDPMAAGTSSAHMTASATSSARAKAARAEEALRAARQRAERELAACADTVELGAKAMTAAHASVIEDWAAHIKAMSDLQSGTNTQDQTDRIWGVTRLRGPERVQKFHAADATYRKAPKACASAEQADLNADQRTEVAACVRLADRTRRALSAARAAAAEWSGHLKAMADRRAGRLNPWKAEVLWLKTYKKAPTNIHRFERAEHAYSVARHDCTLGS